MSTKTVKQSQKQ